MRRIVLDILLSIITCYFNLNDKRIGMQFTLKSDGEYEDLDIQKVQFVATLNWKYYYQLTSSFFINFFKFF